MIVKTVDLYKENGVPAPENAVGRLTCYYGPTSDQISPCRRKPGVLILPGGGYFRTSAREMEPVALRFLAKGYAAFVLEYSCAPHSFPRPLREAAMAIRYIRENCEAFEVDPAMVAAIGFSAGGHLCGMLGTLYDCPEVADLGNSEQIRPDALGLNYPVAVSWGPTHADSFRNISGGDEALAARLSLDKLVRPDMPPVFLWHTRDDESVPCRNSLVLANALEEAGVEFVLHLYRHGKHGLSTADEMVYPVWGVPETSWDVHGWLDAEIRFFAEIGMKIKDLEGKL